MWQEFDQLPRSRDNPILLWIADAKIVRDLITVGAPVRPFPSTSSRRKVNISAQTQNPRWDFECRGYEMG